ncbi:MAG: type 1 glutamine amidotransferase domain-containing protein [Planctomycetota bacterium]
MHNSPKFLALSLAVAVGCSTAPTEITVIDEPVRAYDAPSIGRVLLVAANPAVSEQTGWPIGVWAAELTHPYQEFTAAGYQVDIASPEGGAIEFDSYSDPRDPSGYSAGDLISMGFIMTPKLMERTRSTLRLGDVDPSRYDAVLVCGGQSPMYTFRGNQSLMDFFAGFHATGKPTAAICHGTAILLDTKNASGELLVRGKTWTGFSNAEEDFADAAVGQKIQPFRIEDEARLIDDTSFQVSAPFAAYAVRDGNLITGQQQNSGAAAARLIVEALAERDGQ